MQMARMMEDVLEEHAEEAAILWDNRCDAANSWEYDLDDLCDLDERVEAHLDGLRIAGEQANELLEELSVETAGDLFVIASMALQQQDLARFHQLFEQDFEQPLLLNGLIGSLAWASPAEAKEVVASLLQSTDARKLQVGLGACIAHRANPGKALKTSFSVSDPEVEAMAFQLIAALNNAELLRQFSGNLDATNPAAVLHANRAAASLGDAKARQRLLTFVQSGQPGCRAAADILMPKLDLDTQQTLIRHLASSEESRLLALYCAGLSGQRVWLQDLLKHLPNESYQQECNDAVTLITGVNLLGQLNPLDLEDDTSDDDDQLSDDTPAFDVTDVQSCAERWWAQHQSQFQEGVRYLNGTAITNESLLATLLSGSQRHRGRAAAELSALTGAASFNTLAPAYLQRQRLDRRRA